MVPPTCSQRQAATKDDESNRKQQSNFSKEEDLFLSRAYVNVSQDPIKGNDRKAATFWGVVKDKFNALQLMVTMMWWKTPTLVG